MAAGLCKGICHRTAVSGIHRYADGIKCCRGCRMMFLTDNIHCPCCKRILAIKSREKRSSKTKKSVEIIKAV